MRKKETNENLGRKRRRRRGRKRRKRRRSKRRRRKRRKMRNVIHLDEAMYNEYVIVHAIP